MAQTYYDLLGVAATATLEEITAAYHAKLKSLQDNHHADRNQITVLREIHHILSNELKRDMYDQSLRRAAMAKPRVAVSEGALPADSHPQLAWIKWLLVALIVLVLAFWWYSRKNRPAELSAPQILASRSEKIPGSFATGGDFASAPLADVAPVPASNGSERNAEQIFNEMSVSVARINVSNASGNQISLGSGVVIGPGSVITNCHVTRGGSKFQVKLGNDSYNAQVEVEDRDFDLCRLRVDGLNAPAVRLGQGQRLRSGQKVFAIGAPHGLDLTISDGIVSALREMRSGKVIQTTAPVSPGSSGGGLFDAYGNLVGIVTFQHTQGQNLNFAVPAEWIKEMQTRGPGDNMGALVTTDGSETTSPRSNATSATEQQLIGVWDCHGSIHTNSLEIEFRPNGSLIAKRNGEPFGGNYYVRNKVLRLVSNDALEGELEDLSSSRFILNLGKGYRMVCNRKS